jgi:hypothetical protein
VRTVQVEFEGLKLTATLLDDKAPRICQAIWDSLPLRGQVTNTVWSGEMLRLWVTIPESPDPENLSTLQNPGDVLFLPGWNGLRVVYGPAQMRGPRGPHPAPRVGRLLGDLGEFVKLAKRVEWEGAKSMRLPRGQA